MTTLSIPTLVIAVENDAMFPGMEVVRRAKDIFPNLIAAEWMKDGTHYSSKSELEYLNRRLKEFIG